jgi:hypothetical protein
VAGKFKPPFLLFTPVRQQLETFVRENISVGIGNKLKKSIINNRLRN